MRGCVVVREPREKREREREREVERREESMKERGGAEEGRKTK